MLCVCISIRDRLVPLYPAFLKNLPVCSCLTCDLHIQVHPRDAGTQKDQSCRAAEEAEPQLVNKAKEAGSTDDRWQGVVLPHPGTFTVVHMIRGTEKRLLVKRNGLLN